MLIGANFNELKNSLDNWLNSQFVNKQNPLFSCLNHKVSVTVKKIAPNFFPLSTNRRGVVVKNKQNAGLHKFFKI